MRKVIFIEIQDDYLNIEEVSFVSVENPKQINKYF